MKKLDFSILVIFVILYFFSDLQLLAQVDGPITKTDTLVGFQDIIIVYNECGDEAEIDPGLIHYGLRLNPDYNSVDKKFSEIDFSDNKYIRRNGYYNVIKTGVINNIGQKDAWFTAYNYSTDSLSIKTYYASETEFKDSSWNLTVKTSKFKDMKLAVGNNMHTADLTGEGNINLVTVYTNSNKTYLGIFTYTAGLSLKFETSYEFPGDMNRLLPITVNDFDNDGDDEIIIAYLGDDDEIFLQAFNFSSDYTFIPKNAQQVEGITSPRNIETLELTSGDFDADGDIEIALAYGMPYPCSINEDNDNSGDCEDIRLYTFEIADDASTTDINDPLEKFTYNVADGVKLEIETGNNDEVSPLNLLSGNILNEVGTIRDEIVLGAYDVFLFQADNSLALENKGQFVGTHADYSTLNQFINIANLDGYGTSSIVIVDNYMEDDTKPFFKVQVVDYTVDNEIINQSHILESPIENCNRGYSIVSGFFSGLYFKILGNPEYSSWSELVRPVVIMNTPPAHFDYINETVHDVNTCFGTNNCESLLKYSKEGSSSTEVGITTSTKGDWGFNTEVSLDINIQEPKSGQSLFSVSGINISDLFGDDLGDVTTTNITEETSKTEFIFREDAKRYSRDDAMLALVSDYEKWRYTVTGQHGDTLGELEIINPESKNELTWIEGKNAMILAGYIPTHEQSNFLSYRNSNNANNIELLKSENKDIKAFIAKSTLPKSININSSYSEEISMNQIFNSTDATKVNRVETNPSFTIGIPYFGAINIEDGSIAEEEILSTHSYEVNKGMSLTSQANKIEANAYSYSLTSYYYWSKSGALVIDYMIDLEPGSFWTENYGVENPGFLFMNRLDSMKINSELDLITDMDEYTKTTSIYTLPVSPKSGEIIYIGAMIHNLSLEETSDSVAVKFYLGKPNNGGIELADTSGNTLFYTDGSIESQSFKTVSMVWESDFEIDDRIYCVIDPENNLSENNENDNLGWAPINRLKSYQPGGPTDINQQQYQFGDLTERLNFYPNPASEFVTLDYNGPSFKNGIINISSLNGQIIKQEIIESEQELMGGFSVDIRNLSPGMYYIIFKTDTYKQHSKILVQ